MKRFLLSAIVVAPTLFVAVGDRNVSAQSGNPPTKTATLSHTTCPGTGCVTFNVTALGSIGVQVTGTFSGTLTFYGSVDGSTFAALSLTPIAGGSAVSTTTGTGIWTGTVSGLSMVEVAFTSFSSGNAVVSLVRAQARSGGGSGGGGGGNTFATIQVGTAPFAATGEIQLDKNASINARNATNSGDIQLLMLAGGTVQLSPGGNSTQLVGPTTIIGGNDFTVGTGGHLVLSNAVQSSSFATASLSLTNAQVLALPTAPLQILSPVDSSHYLFPIAAQVSIHMVAFYTNIAQDDANVNASAIRITFGGNSNGGFTDAFAPVPMTYIAGANRGSHDRVLFMYPLPGSNGSNLQGGATDGSMFSGLYDRGPSSPVFQDKLQGNTLFITANNNAGGNFTGGDAGNTFVVNVLYQIGTF